MNPVTFLYDAVKVLPTDTHPDGKDDITQKLPWRYANTFRAMANV